MCTSRDSVSLEGDLRSTKTQNYPKRPVHLSTLCPTPFLSLTLIVYQKEIRSITIPSGPDFNDVICRESYFLYCPLTTIKTR